MSRDSITPKLVGPTPDGTALEIRWKDGHVSLFKPRRLRLKCPCAGCVDEMTGQPILVPSQIPDDVYPTAINYVGRYALQFVWNDGHDTGLYSFETLRGLCACNECQGNQ